LIKTHFARSREREQLRTDSLTYVLIDYEQSRMNVLLLFS